MIIGCYKVSGKLHSDYVDNLIWNILIGVEVVP
jgi:hypothetical protein